MRSRWTCDPSFRRKLALLGLDSLVLGAVTRQRFGSSVSWGLDCRWCSMDRGLDFPDGETFGDRGWWFLLVSLP
jgi:hypothetical protein